MTKVTDERLAQFFRFQHDINQRVFKGALDPDVVEMAIRPLIGQGPKRNATQTSHLRLISGDRTLKISAGVGGPKASLAYAEKTFPGYLDNDFKNWKLDTNQPVTTEAEAEVWELRKDGTFNSIFNSFGVNLQHLKWDSQEQIKKFCEENRSELRTDGFRNFFLFEEEVGNEKEFFVASVRFGDDSRLELSVFRMSRDGVWSAENQRRFVLPATMALGR